MLEHKELCECMKNLMAIGHIKPYCPPYNYMAEGFEDVEEGQLCMANQIAEDLGHYNDYEWVSMIEMYDELYPINFCPICGKKIEYIKYPELTKKL